MAGSTPIYGFPYPEPSDLVANYPALGQQLAEDVEDALGSGGNYTLINTGGTALTGAATITVTGISGKRSLFVWVSSASSTSASSQVRIRFNTDASNNYYYAELGILGTGVYAEATLAGHWTLAQMGNAAGNEIFAGVQIDGTNASGIKVGNFTGTGTGSSTNGSFTGNGFYVGTSPITSVSLVSTSGNFDAGTIFVYGA